MRAQRKTRTSRFVIGLTLMAMLVMTAALPAVAAPGGQNESNDPTALSGHAPHGVTSQDTLRRIAPRDFYIGVAVAGGGHHEWQDYPDPFTYDQEYRRILAAEFNSLSPENQMKWEFIHPERGRYNFGPADAIVEFARQNNQVVRGHTLLWHSQNPAWLEQGNFTPQELREILREHVFTVVGRYAGKIQQWDVANEIFRDNGQLRTTENIWIRELGIGIVADVFRWAHEADPNALLFFNDYNVEGINAKSNAYYALVQNLLAQGVPIHGWSAQAHYGLQWGFDGSLQANLQRFADLGLETAITEIDVRMILNGRAPTQQQLDAQAERYRRALQACLNVEGCNSFTVWGATDKYSWVPVFFANQGAATIMWDNFERKPAYYALYRTLFEARMGELRAELDRLADAGDIPLGMEQRIRHALDTFEGWIQNPRQRGPALSHLDRAVRLLLWQADVIERSRPNQGDAAALRALAELIRSLEQSYR